MADPLPVNRASFSLDEILGWTGGRLVWPDARTGSKTVTGVSTDTRTLARGNAFVALVGPRFDGHTFTGRAVELGAVVLIVSGVQNAPVGPGVSVILVDDTTRALGSLARGHRRRWASASPNRRVVAITGSAGKTTTRQAAEALLRHAGFHVHATAANLNNQIGVPMVLLGLEPDHDVAVIEIGTNARGEIAYGASIAEPDVSILTLVSAAHTEGLGGVEHVAIEKGALLEALRPDGVAIVSGDDPLVVAQLGRARLDPSRGGRRALVGCAPSCDVRVVSREARGLSGSRVAIVVGERMFDLDTPLLGTAGAYASAFAVATLAALPGGLARLDAAGLGGAFAGVTPEGGRLAAKRRADGAIVLDDTYNANRASMVASIRAAREIASDEGRRLVLVLGEMLELGELSTSEHDAVGGAIVEARCDWLVAVRGDATRYDAAARRAGIETEFVSGASAASARLRGAIGPGDLVLIKGSNGVGLGRVVRDVLGDDGSATKAVKEILT